MKIRFRTYLIFCVWCWLHSEKVAKRRLRIRTRVWPHRPPFHPGPPFCHQPINDQLLAFVCSLIWCSNVQMFWNQWLAGIPCKIACLMFCWVLKVYPTCFKVYWFLPMSTPFLCQISNSHRLSDSGHCLGFLSIAQWSLGKWQPYHVLAFYIMFHLFLNSCIVH